MVLRCPTVSTLTVGHASGWSAFEKASALRMMVLVLVTADPSCGRYALPCAEATAEKLPVARPRPSRTSCACSSGPVVA